MDSTTYLTESARTVSHGLHADKAGPAALAAAIDAAEAAGKIVDAVKRSLFYGSTLPDSAPDADPRGLSIDAEEADLLHAALGLTTEAIEFLEAVAKSMRGGGLDEVNLREELGDLEWYMALAHRRLGSTPEEVRERNIAKLRRRFPAKFEGAQALSRDLDAERRALEGKE